MAMQEKDDKGEEKKDEDNRLTRAEKLEQGWIFCRVILEVLGKPKEHVEETIKSFVDKMKEDKELEIVKEHYSEPKPQEALFSIFSELELWMKGPSKIVSFCIDYMPSSIEVIEPEKLTYKNNELSAFLNDMQANLHNLDMITKNLKMENTVLKKNSSVIVRNIITLSLNEKIKDLDEVAADTGINKDELEKFMKILLDQKIIGKKADKYELLAKKKLSNESENGFKEQSSLNRLEKQSFSKSLEKLKTFQKEE